MATIPTTGVSLSALQTNLGGSNPTGLSEYYTNGSYTYSLPNIGYGTIPTSGPISMGLFRGQGIYVLRNIVTSVSYNLRTWATTNGWNGTSAIIIKIDYSCSFYSLIIDGSWPGGLTVLNYANILAAGGNGGSNGGAGGGGQTALTIAGTSIITFKNYGTIAGGGGGGGSSTIAPVSPITTWGYLWPGGGGGAGGGAGGSGIRSKGGTYGTNSGGSGGSTDSSGSAGSYATPVSGFAGAAAGTQGYGGGAGGGGGGTFYYSYIDSYYASGGGGGGRVIGGAGGGGGNAYFYTSGGSYSAIGGSGGTSYQPGSYGTAAGGGGAGQIGTYAGAGGGGGWGAYGGGGAYGWTVGGVPGTPGNAIYKGGNTNFSYTNFGTLNGAVS